MKGRFWEHVEIGEPDECWPWKLGRSPKGYGNTLYKVGGRNVAGAHRIAWSKTFGTIPDGLHVLHRCDNPPCCNPSHLWLGTNTENHADSKAKGRTHRPVNQPRDERGLFVKGVAQ